jgi:hypothetical protein
MIVEFLIEIDARYRNIRKMIVVGCVDSFRLSNIRKRSEENKIESEVDNVRCKRWAAVKHVRAFSLSYSISLSIVARARRRRIVPHVSEYCSWLPAHFDPIAGYWLVDSRCHHPFSRIIQSVGRKCEKIIGTMFALSPPPPPLLILPVGHQSINCCSYAHEFYYSSK